MVCENCSENDPSYEALILPSLPMGKAQMVLHNTLPVIDCAHSYYVLLEEL